MKLSTALLALCYAAVASAEFQIPFSTINEDSLKVPGENPLSYFHDPSDYILQVYSLDLVPNPPTPGKTLSIHAVGNLSQPITEGSYAHVTVKLGLIKLLSKSFDICEEAKKAGENCPFHEGLWDITKEIELPKEIPPAKFNVEIMAYTVDDEEITCMKGTVDFTMHFGRAEYNASGDL